MRRLRLGIVKRICPRINSYYLTKVILGDKNQEFLSQCSFSPLFPTTIINSPKTKQNNSAGKSKRISFRIRKLFELN